MKQFFQQLYHLFDPRRQLISLEYPVDVRPRYGHNAGPAHEKLKEIIAHHSQRYTTLLQQSLHYKNVWAQFSTRQDHTIPERPFWLNGYLPPLDAILLYTLLVEIKPKRYIEIGSGHSTRLTRWAIDRQGLATLLVSIDPSPRAEITSLVNEHYPTGIENIELEVFSQLEAGDILFIDNSHRLLPNSDVTRIFLEVLPMLPVGVYVHFHDIYLPFDYPPFMCDRYYSEQYALAILLMANPNRYETVMPNYWVSQELSFAAAMNDIWQEMPDMEKHGGSYWIKIASAR